MLISLSGLDGAGKSTLAEALRSRLEKHGVSAVIFHMNKDVGLYAYLRNARDTVTRAIRPGRQRRDLASQGPSRNAGEPIGRAKAALLEIRRRIIWNKSLRRWVDLGDLATFLLYRAYIEKLRGRVLIMDRYFYDRMADIADGQRWRYLRWFAGVAPTPDVAVLVEVSPEEAFLRKQEYSVASMTSRRAIYKEIFSWLPHSVILANDDLDVALNSLEQIVLEHLKGTGRTRLAAES
jgi:thymidylate kinase